LLRLNGCIFTADAIESKISNAIPLDYVGAYRTRTRNVAFNPARSASVSYPRPQKVSGTKMLRKSKEFGQDVKKPTFPSSSPLTRQAVWSLQGYFPRILEAPPSWKFRSPSGVIHREAAPADGSEHIKVVVKNGWVTLEGQAEWEYQRRTAEKAVEGIKGVKGVSNLIQSIRVELELRHLARGEEAIICVARLLRQRQRERKLGQPLGRIKTPARWRCQSRDRPCALPTD
jgi:hypothetical protein